MFFLIFPVIHLLPVVQSNFFASFARHIHISFVWQYFEHVSGAGKVTVFLLGAIFLCCAFWLHFCVSRFAAQEYNKTGYGGSSSFIRLIFSAKWIQFFRVLGLSFCVSFLTASGCMLGIFPGIFLHPRFFAVFPVLADHPDLPFLAVLQKSWSITRPIWRLIMQFSVEAFLLYFSAMYFCSYLFLVVIVPLARYVWCRTLAENLS